MGHLTENTQEGEVEKTQNSITNFFERMREILDNNVFFDSTTCDHRKVNLFKTLCLWDYMGAACDWDASSKDQEELGSGKESYPFALMNNMLDKNYEVGFYCEKCDDFGPFDDCTHDGDRHDRFDQLEEFMMRCEQNLELPLTDPFKSVKPFELPTLLTPAEFFGENPLDLNKISLRKSCSQDFVDCTKQLFDDKEIDYHMLLNDLHDRYFDDMINFC